MTVRPIVFAQASTVVPNAVINTPQATSSLKSKPSSVNTTASVVAKMKRVRVSAVSQPASLTAVSATMERLIQMILSVQRKTRNFLKRLTRPGMLAESATQRELPDLDFHHSFGSFLTRKNPVVESADPDIGRYWALLNTSPTMLQYHIHSIGDRYREAFRRFFTAEPISLHGHVSDASSPALLTSLIAHLTSRYSTSDCNSFLSKGDQMNPCVAVLEGSYGAGYGPGERLF